MYTISHAYVPKSPVVQSIVILTKLLVNDLLSSLIHLKPRAHNFADKMTFFQQKKKKKKKELSAYRVATIAHLSAPCPLKYNFNITRNVTVCNTCPQRSLVRDTPSHYALSFCDVSLNLLQ